MALKSTIFKAELSVADVDRSHYGDYALTIARHPSETDERMMVRLLAFALNASDTLAFGKGLSTEDEPDLWRRDLTGAIALWIDVGLPDEKDVRKACGRAGEVHVYAYGGRSVALWWNKARDRLDALPRLGVSEVPIDASRALATMTARSMHLHCTIQEDNILFGDAAASVSIELVVLKAAGAATGAGK